MVGIFDDDELGKKDFPDCACVENGGCPFLQEINFNHKNPDFGIAKCALRGDVKWMETNKDCELIPIPLFPLIKGYWNNNELTLKATYENLKEDIYYGDPNRAGGY